MTVLDNLAPEEAEIYLSLVALGQLTAGELASIKNIGDPQSVPKIIESLINRGLAKKMPGNVPKIIALYPFDEVLGTADKAFKQLSTIITELETFVSERGKSIAAEVNKHREEINQQILGVRDNIESDSSIVISSLKENLDGMKFQVSKIIEDAKNHSQEELTRFVANSASTTEATVSEYISTLEESTNSVIASVNDTTAAVQNATDQQVQKSSTSLEQARQDLTSTFTSVDGTVNDHEARLRKQAQNLTIALTELVNSTETAIKDSLGTGTETSKQETVKILQEVKNSLQGSLESLRVNQDLLLQEISTEQQPLTRDVLVEHDAIVTDVLNNHVKELTTQVQDLSSNFTTELLDYKQKLSQLLDDIQQKTSGVFDSVKTAVDDGSNQIQNDLKSRIEQINQGVNNIVSTKVEQATAGLAGFVSENTNTIVDSISQAENGFVTRQQQFIEDSQLQLRKMVEEGLEKINQVTSSAVEEIANLTRTTGPVLQERQQSLLNLLNDEFQLFEQLMKENIANITNLTTGMTQHASLIANDIKNKTENLKTQLSEGVTGIQSETLAKLTAEFSNVVDQSSSVIAQLESECNAAIGKMKMVTFEQLDKTQSAVAKGIEGELAAVTEGVEGYAKQFNEKAKLVQDQVKAVSESVNAVSDKASEIPPFQPDTQPIFGLKGISSYIRNMVERMSAGVTLLTPELKWLPVDLIKGSKISQRISIVIPPGEMQKYGSNAYPEETDIIKSFLSKTNIRIRTMEGIEMNYLAADRDGEELCLGISGTKPEESVGLATVNEAYITLFGKIVIGDYFLARSKEVQRSAYGL
ncbi:MAG: helix-turn-helix domain-containing protein [Candidatus Odinarchaeota archaeon]